ncbi:hypothetical protein CEK71_21095 [Methylovulum psychrotolerans]|uniref:Uncharacterized protein n=1 Tax=Methylovulum psychrotolerans TaxID=1704499 RepID=A0A1Z4C473_9GAMM|nr:hypothetical protein CEK71_21095 [Methylovulum psychrotolerans]
MKKALFRFSPPIEENRVQDNVFRIVGTFKADLHSLATKIGGLSPKIRKFATEPVFTADSGNWPLKWANRESIGGIMDIIAR